MIVARFGAVAVIILSLVIGMPGTLAEGQPGQPMRLILDGETLDVVGPVERDGTMLTFFTEEGRLASIQASRVRRVIARSPTPPVAKQPAPARRAPAAPRRATPPTGRSGSFSNDDLPAATGTGGTTLTNADLDPAAVTATAPPSTALTNADLPETAVVDETATESLPAPTAPPGALTNADLPEPVVVEPPADDVTPAAEPSGGADADALRAELAELDGRIAVAEEEENLYYRMMVCVQNGHLPRSKECTPTLRPKPSADPSVSERSLAAKMKEARRQVDAMQRERTALIERGRSAGVELETP